MGYRYRYRYTGSVSSILFYSGVRIRDSAETMTPWTATEITLVRL